MNQVYKFYDRNKLEQVSPPSCFHYCHCTKKKCNTPFLLADISTRGGLEILWWNDTLNLGMNVDFSSFGNLNSYRKRMENRNESFPDDILGSI